MNQMETVFTIKEENFDKCLKAIQALDPVKEHGGGVGFTDNGVATHFAWVTTERFRNAKILQEALNAWRWQPEYMNYKNCEGIGDITNIYFEGEKLGDDQTLFQAIAPFVEADSYIQMRGEDDSMWRWRFDGKMCYEDYPTVTWE